MDGEYRTCRQCGNTFFADQPWKRVCFDCWKESKKQSGQWRGGTEGFVYTDAAWAKMEVARLRQENQALDRQVAALQEALYSKANYSAIPPDMLRRIIQLCHPDKHNNSPAATEATQWLLKQRQ